MRVPPVLLLREYGGWAILLVPMTAGVAVAGKWSIDVLLTMVAAVAGFTGSRLREMLLRHWAGRRLPADRLHQALLRAGVFLGISVASAGMVLIRVRALLLVAGAACVAYLGAVAIALERPKTLAADLLGTIGLTLSGPAVSLAAHGAWRGTA